MPVLSKAAEWTGNAAESGVPEAQVEYGVMLFKGEGVAVDGQGNVYGGEVGPIQGVTKFVPRLKK